MTAPNIMYSLKTFGSPSYAYGYFSLNIVLLMAFVVLDRKSPVSGYKVAVSGNKCGQALLAHRSVSASSPPLYLADNCYHLSNGMFPHVTCVTVSRAPMGWLTATANRNWSTAQCTAVKSLKPVHTCCRKRQLCIRKQATLLPFRAILLPFSATMSPVSGVATFCKIIMGFCSDRA